MLLCGADREGRDGQSTKTVALGTFPPRGWQLSGCISSKACPAGLAEPGEGAVPAPPAWAHPKGGTLLCWKPWAGPGWGEQLRLTAEREFGASGDGVK